MADGRVSTPGRNCSIAWRWDGDRRTISRCSGIDYIVYRGRLDTWYLDSVRLLPIAPRSALRFLRSNRRRPWPRTPKASLTSFSHHDWDFYFASSCCRSYSSGCASSSADFPCDDTLALAASSTCSSSSSSSTEVGLDYGSSRMIAVCISRRLLVVVHRTVDEEAICSATVASASDICWVERTVAAAGRSRGTVGQNLAVAGRSLAAADRCAHVVEKDHALLVGATARTCGAAELPRHV